ncbi:MAG: hypothetical protein KAT65_17765 [Methanophagales archaeon]|nr:hypothetical protein [Methanophagales archaeon]
MKDTQKIIQEIIDNIILESKKKAFKSEDEIQGYISGNLRYLIEDNFEFIREFPTSEKYKRAEDGILFKAAKGNHGYIDLVIKRDGMPFVGIEVEYPRGAGLKNAQNFNSHLKNDILKLNNEPITLRYLLVFIYNDPPFDYKNAIQSLKFEEVYFAYIRLCRRAELEGEKAVKEGIIIPDNWLKV